MKKAEGTKKDDRLKQEEEAPVQRVARLLDRYQWKKGMLIPIMQDIQEECEYLPVDVLKALYSTWEIVSYSLTRQLFQNTLFELVYYFYVVHDFELSFVFKPDGDFMTVVPECFPVIG